MGQKLNERGFLLGDKVINNKVPRKGPSVVILFFSVFVLSVANISIFLVLLILFKVIKCLIKETKGPRDCESK